MTQKFDKKVYTIGPGNAAYVSKFKNLLIPVSKKKLNLYKKVLTFHELGRVVFEKDQKILI